ncbi:dipeptidase PepV [Lactiplantibacillus mudanjiangensis]|uniref:Dipeptidase PepV [Lactobacillus sp.] n=1 Tax=Lactiplantibacillus mudanjiangensis TaxID=1296538 RepID=A0A660E059_9LACO|nr:dipeptidase PepV [Lactiplantibacillus mudanjiangensis]VDG18496.1 dipeptidase PepV [Lactobacillus sp.] [Lactiplantibacillus mudanjiangensis]VDG25912.1 dipeptidase PepV [Lactobacillus sp.] [Lactiplantibacillus mudanjiangensis]VDG28864.1 dipeptidase PepV [Lactobacillus sp.] [Lactiplantibacillus mudanjiangensis]VDG33743.1 dipeptidase PepV [Lactobacillus sp.] [Lactiplantibacillus mudanjiangensis]
MTIDWSTEAAKRQDDYLADLTTMLRVPSFRDDSQATDDAPLGPGPKKALETFLAIAKRDGFKTKNIDNLVGYAEYGEGDETLAVLAHVDTMPAGNGWDTDPFEPTIKDGKLYARGASDDKGPGMAAYYGLKMVKDLGLKLNKKVRFIVGTDEESNWTGMKRYFEVEPAPTLGFSPDAEFPLINGEKGNVSLQVHFGNTDTGDFNLVSFESGLRENMVPREAVAVVSTDNNEQLAADFTAYLDEQPVIGELTVVDAGVRLEVIGKAAHGMEPRNGINAGTYLADFLQRYAFAGDAKNFLGFIAEKLHVDSRVEHLGLAFTDDVMGDLTMNVGLLHFDHQNGGDLTLNFRYPKGIEPATLTKGVKAELPAGATVSQGDFMVPHYVDPEDPIVKDLMDVYRRQTGDVDSQPEIVGGGTYGRMMARGVAFGALFPHTEDTMHQANEFQPVADLMAAMSIYGESIAVLATDK